MKENPSDPKDPRHSDASGGVDPNTPADVPPDTLGPPNWSERDERNAAAREELHRRINNDFTYHPPPGPHVTVIYTRIRGLARQFAHELVELCPPGRELSTALTKLEECVMHANAGIARSGGS